MQYVLPLYYYPLFMSMYRQHHPYKNRPLRAAVFGFIRSTLPYLTPPHTPGTPALPHPDPTGSPDDKEGSYNSLLPAWRIPRQTLPLRLLHLRHTFRLDLSDQRCQRVHDMRADIAADHHIHDVVPGLKLSGIQPYADIIDGVDSSPSTASMSEAPVAITISHLSKDPSVVLLIISTSFFVLKYEFIVWLWYALKKSTTYSLSTLRNCGLSLSAYFLSPMTFFIPLVFKAESSFSVLA